LITIGTVSALPTAAAGFTDYTTAPRKALRSGTVHGLLNVVALSLFFFSTLSRKACLRGLGMLFSGMGMGVATLSAWLGGDLVYKYQVGVNKALQPKQPTEWKAVMPETELIEQQPVRKEVDGFPVLLYRYGGTVYAIGAVCSHEGGPLEEGSFDGYCVECPWHQSVFDIRDGSVVHGPATTAEPDYLARIHNGFVEIRIQDQ
jgi:nitrite reductase/ring-hydroxylating ferredoxin subunit